MIGRLIFMFFLLFTSIGYTQDLSSVWSVWKGKAETVINGKPCGSIMTVQHENSLYLYSTCGRSTTNKNTVIEISGGELGKNGNKRWEFEWTPLLEGPNSRTKTMVLADIKQNPDKFREILDAMHTGAVMTVGFENSEGTWWERPYTLSGFEDTYKEL